MKTYVGAGSGQRRKTCFCGALVFLVEFYVDMLGSRFCPLDSLYLEHI